MRSPGFWWFLVAALFGVLVTLPATAAESRYSRISLSDCPVIAAPVEAEDSPRYLCDGYLGIKVAMQEGDLRWFVAYGVDPQNHTAFHQTVSPFNWVFKDGDEANPMVIEWRIDDLGQVYAAIQRFYIDGEERGSYLVVTRLFPADSCRIAEIAAHQVADANVIARQFADQSLQLAGCPPAPIQYP